jgi:hypothetical protein
METWSAKRSSDRVMKYAGTYIRFVGWCNRHKVSTNAFGGIITLFAVLILFTTWPKGPMNEKLDSYAVIAILAYYAFWTIHAIALKLSSRKQ